MATVFTEGRHAAAFILSEANGQRSRENVTVAAHTTVEVGEILAGGIAIYGVVTGDTAEQISIIARDAEVNGHCLAWASGASESDMTTIAATLAEKGIIVRGFPGDEADSPLP